MNERVVRAIMQLFAIIAKINENQNTENNSDNEEIIRSFLKIELIASRIDLYVELFNEYYAKLGERQSSSTGGQGKRTTVNSVKVLRICHEINKELTIRQRFIVLMRIMELILKDDKCSDHEFSFLSTVADSFRIPTNEYLLIFSLLKNEITSDTNHDNCFIIEGEKSTAPNHFYLQGLDKPIVCIQTNKNELILFKYLGDDNIYLNGELLDNRKAFIFSTGGSLNTSKSERLYQVDLINHFYKTIQKNQFIFKATDISFRFNNRKTGLRPFTYEVKSGNLVGIMGVSGSGKSTLIDLLSGAKRPNTGTVTINGIDVHSNLKEIEGRIGYVPQNDLLIEDLTVFQNLYFNAKLCFADASEIEIKRKVVQLLNDLNLNDIKHLKVGSQIKNIISGGQRKRLNIALELIRNPAVLFVDEPTSGLSSIGSLKIMNILKELSLKGTLVFVVIHQPSSDVFKLFNELIILDTGGYQIYSGTPSVAPTYFKRYLEFANADSDSCLSCGNMNPEEIFDTIESKTINEFGVPNRERKYNPEKWYQLFKENQQKKATTEAVDQAKLSIPKPLSKPRKIQQFFVYFQRDFTSKIYNFQYLLMILVEAPLLAFIMSFFLKYHIEIDGVSEYIYYYNENIPVFLFVSVLVALFLGMTVAAEEINKDKRSLKRERFLHLSWKSYLFSKISILAIISAIQSFLYIAIGSFILDIRGFWFEFWVVMFSTSVSANLIGLNISSAFRQTKLIYILIPIIIIPQIIFSGLITTFDRMNPIFSHPQKVPMVGNLFVSRWSFEALVVKIASENEFSNITFDLRRMGSENQWKKDYWIPQMHKLTEDSKNYSFIKKEMEKELANWDNLTCTNCFEEDKLNLESINRTLHVLQLQFTNNYNIINDSIEVIKHKVGLKNYNNLKEIYSNEGIENLVTNRSKLEKIKVDPVEQKIYQIKDPIYQSSKNFNFGSSPLYIKEKRIWNYPIDTFTINIVVIWLFTLLFYFTLQFEVFKRLILFYKFMRHQVTKKTSNK